MPEKTIDPRNYMIFHSESARSKEREEKNNNLTQQAYDHAVQNVECRCIYSQRRHIGFFTPLERWFRLFAAAAADYACMFVCLFA